MKTTPEPALDFNRKARDVRRALMVTAFLEVETEGGYKHERVSDQMRRMLALLNELTFEEGRNGVWVRNQAALARALSMDKGDASRALASLARFKVAAMEERDDGWLWIELRASRLALAGRALEGRAAMEWIEMEHRDRVHQPEIPGVERCVAQGRNYGLDAAIGEVAAEADREAFARLPGVCDVGKVPTGEAIGWESPNDDVGKVPTRALGNSQLGGVLVGKVPTAPVDNRARVGAPGDSPNRQIGDSIDSGESGAVAPGGSGRQFRDGEKNYVFAELAKLDVLAELRDETCRRTWIGRIRDHMGPISEAIGEVREEKARGKTIKSPLGRVFVKAQSIARNLGKVMRCWL